MKEKSLSSRANAGPRRRRRNYHRVERTYKNFRRVFPLLMAVRHDHIQAVLKNGVLEITVMKEEQAKPK
jgi:HSP20 family molecular chaperone IbpA